MFELQHDFLPKRAASSGRDGDEMLAEVEATRAGGSPLRGSRMRSPSLRGVGALGVSVSRLRGLMCTCFVE